MHAGWRLVVYIVTENLRIGAGLKIYWKIDRNLAKMRLILHSILGATKTEGYENEENKTISRPKLSD